MNFQKYSNSRDLLYSFIIVIILILIIPKHFIINFDAQKTSDSLLQFFGVLFVFILTIITIMFMFDYTKSPILKKLEDDDLFNQMFKRLFDTLIIISVAVIYFLILMMYFRLQNDITYVIYNYTISLTLILNTISLILIISSIIRIYRSIKLLSLIYKALNYK